MPFLIITNYGTEQIEAESFEAAPYRAINMCSEDGLVGIIRLPNDD